MRVTGERVLWEGRPDWRAVARDVLHIRLLAGYLAAMLIYGFASDRADGWDVLDTLWRGVPLLTIGAVALSACSLFAWAIARTTRYTVTTERCVLAYGVALTATLSVPLRRVASVGVAARGDGYGDVLLSPKAGARLHYTKLWPHARPWRWARAEPMLRGVPNAVAVAAAIGTAALAVAPGVVHASPVRRARSPAPGYVDASLAAAAAGAGD